MASGNIDLALDLIATALVSHLARLISIDPQRIDPHKTSILDLGVDSLISIELRNWIMREFDTPVQASEILIDQNVYSLAEKIVSRLRDAFDSTDDSSSENNAIIGTPDSTEPDLTVSKSAIVETLKDGDAILSLPSLSFPPLMDILAHFNNSRKAIDCERDQKLTTDAIDKFLAGQGSYLHRVVERMSGGSISENYEHHIYLRRREPLQDYSTFSLIHPVTAPSHSQAIRATILTIAAMEYYRKLAAGQMAPDALHGRPLDTRPREWLFHATRRPGLVVDYMERFQETQTVVILRRGHVFEMSLPRRGETILPASVLSAFKSILNSSLETKPDVGTFTADERPNWADTRSKLQLWTENAYALSAIDRCAFIVCLDDGAPSTGGERHTQFLVNCPEDRLANRWYDRTFQIAVAANGVSAEVYEHTKMDGIDVRQLHHVLTQALFSDPGDSMNLDNSDSLSMAYPTKELYWKLDNEIVEQINHIQLRGSRYGVIDHSVLQIDALGANFLRSQHVLPNTTAHLTILLAMYIVDRRIRPAWEIVSLAPFSHGRIDWVQTVTPATKSFVEAAAAVTSSTKDERLRKDQQTSLRALFDAATAAHNRLIAKAANGHGFVRHMYALMGAMASISGDDDASSIFTTPAWDATRRGGPGQDLKIGFMPTEGQPSDEWDEGGFLMQGERGIYIHCAVEEHLVKFSVSARPEYMQQVCEGLRDAARLILRVIAS